MELKVGGKQSLSVPLVYWGRFSAEGVWVALFDAVLGTEPALSPLYCSQVLYQVEGFVDKNNDLLYRDLSQAMWKAGHALIKSLFPEGNPAKVNLKRPPTAGSQFKASVATLMKNLQTKNPNYIRYLLSRWFQFKCSPSRE